MMSDTDSDDIAPFEASFWEEGAHTLSEDDDAIQALSDRLSRRRRSSSVTGTPPVQPTKLLPTRRASDPLNTSSVGSDANNTTRGLWAEAEEVAPHLAELCKSVGSIEALFERLEAMCEGSNTGNILQTVQVLQHAVMLDSTDAEYALRNNGLLLSLRLCDKDPSADAVLEACSQVVGKLSTLVANMQTAYSILVDLAPVAVSLIQSIIKMASPLRPGMANIIEAIAAFAYRCSVNEICLKRLLADRNSLLPAVLSAAKGLPDIGIGTLFYAILAAGNASLAEDMCEKLFLLPGEVMQGLVLRCFDEVGASVVATTLGRRSEAVVTPETQESTPTLTTPRHLEGVSSPPRLRRGSAEATAAAAMTKRYTRSPQKDPEARPPRLPHKGACTPEGLTQLDLCESAIFCLQVALDGSLEQQIPFHSERAVASLMNTVRALAMCVYNVLSGDGGNGEEKAIEELTFLHSVLDILIAMAAPSGDSSAHQLRILQSFAQPVVVEHSLQGMHTTQRGLEVLKTLSTDQGSCKHTHHTSSVVDSLKKMLTIAVHTASSPGTSHCHAVFLQGGGAVLKDILRFFTDFDASVGNGASEAERVLFCVDRQGVRKDEGGEGNGLPHGSACVLALCDLVASVSGGAELCEFLCQSKLPFELLRVVCGSGSSVDDVHDVACVALKKISIRSDTRWAFLLHDRNAVQIIASRLLALSCTNQKACTFILTALCEVSRSTEGKHILLSEGIVESLLSVLHDQQTKQARQNTLRTRSIAILRSLGEFFARPADVVQQLLGCTVQYDALKETYLKGIQRDVTTDAVYSVLSVSGASAQLSVLADCASTLLSADLSPTDALASRTVTALLVSVFPSFTTSVSGVVLPVSPSERKRAETLGISAVFLLLARLCRSTENAGLLLNSCQGVDVVLRVISILTKRTTDETERERISGCAGVLLCTVLRFSVESVGDDPDISLIRSAHNEGAGALPRLMQSLPARAAMRCGAGLSATLLGASAEEIALCASWLAALSTALDVPEVPTPSVDVAAIIASSEESIRAEYVSSEQCTRRSLELEFQLEEKHLYLLMHTPDANLIIAQRLATLNNAETGISLLLAMSEHSETELRSNLISTETAIRSHLTTTETQEKKKIIEDEGEGSLPLTSAPSTPLNTHTAHDAVSKSISSRRRLGEKFTAKHITRKEEGISPASSASSPTYGESSGGQIENGVHSSEKNGGGDVIRALLSTGLLSAAHIKALLTTESRQNLLDSVAVDSTTSSPSSTSSNGEHIALLSAAFGVNSEVYEPLSHNVLEGIEETVLATAKLRQRTTDAEIVLSSVQSISNISPLADLSSEYSTLAIQWERAGTEVPKTLRDIESFAIKQRALQRTSLQHIIATIGDAVCTLDPPQRQVSVMTSSSSTSHSTSFREQNEKNGTEAEDIKESVEDLKEQIQDLQEEVYEKDELLRRLPISLTRIDEERRFLQRYKEGTSTGNTTTLHPEETSLRICTEENTILEADNTSLKTEVEELSRTLQEVRKSLANAQKVPSGATELSKCQTEIARLNAALACVKSENVDLQRCQTDLDDVRAEHHKALRELRANRESLILEEEKYVANARAREAGGAISRTERRFADLIEANKRHEAAEAERNELAASAHQRKLDSEDKDTKARIAAAHYSEACAWQRAAHDSLGRDLRRLQSEAASNTAHFERTKALLNERLHLKEEQIVHLRSSLTREQEIGEDYVRRLRSACQEVVAAEQARCGNERTLTRALGTATSRNKALLARNKTLSAANTKLSEDHERVVRKLDKYKVYPVHQDAELEGDYDNVEAKPVKKVADLLRAKHLDQMHSPTALEGEESLSCDDSSAAATERPPFHVGTDAVPRTVYDFTQDKHLSHYLHAREVAQKNSHSSKHNKKKTLAAETARRRLARREAAVLDWKHITFIPAATL